MANGHVAPANVRANARRGLELRREFGRGGTAVGIARARDIANGSALSLSTIKRMNSFFARHEVDKKGENWGNRSNPSNGYIAWLLWGGDAGWSWAKKIIRQNESKEKSTMTELTSTFFGIEKADRHADGTMTVYGKATDDSLDIDQQICDADWLKRAMPHWFSTGGNIREQHSNIAAGVAKEYELKDDGHYITALVVDPVSVKKVENGVLKGFSIGIKNPRVARDKSAANGRIIDGQIVEVSLVDRPANPNCQLVLAKSVGSDETVVQVEELHDLSETNSDNTLELDNTLREENMKTAAELIEESKKFLNGDIQKFDAKAYEIARNALARLIQVEAKEIEEGHDEQMSLAHLLEAIRHLFAWYEGEEAEGEVVETVEEKSAKKEMKPKKGEAKDDFMKRCKDAGMDDDDAAKCWKKYMAAEDDAEKAAKKDSDSDDDDAKKESDDDDVKKKKKEADDEEDDEEDDDEAKKGKHKSADVAKCLECGCNQPGNDHGLTVTNDFANVAKPSHVTTAEMYSPDQTPKSAQVSTNKVDIEAIVEQAIKSATQSIKSDIADLMTAKEAAEAKASRLETELAEAKSLAVAGGPKRTAKPVNDNSNDLLLKAAAYNAKAQATTDPTLAKGYAALAKEFLAKASTDSK